MNRSAILKTTAGLFVLALPLTGCSSSKPDTGSGAGAPAGGNAPAATTQAAGQKASKNYKLQFIQGVAGDQFYISMQCGIEAEAKKAGRQR